MCSGKDLLSTTYKTKFKTNANPFSLFMGHL